MEFQTIPKRHYLSTNTFFVNTKNNPKNSLQARPEIQWISNSYQGPRYVDNHGFQLPGYLVIRVNVTGPPINTIIQIVTMVGFLVTTRVLSYISILNQ